MIFFAVQISVAFEAVTHVIAQRHMEVITV